MYDSPRRRGGFNRLADDSARQTPAEAHQGSYRDLLRRHRRESATAARGTRKQRDTFADCLFRRTADSRNLKCAIDHLAKEESSAPGPNGLKLVDLDVDEKWELARVLKRVISTGAYRPGPHREVDIPKSSGRGTRTIQVQDVEDRVVQRAIVQTLEPFLDPAFAEASYGYRPRRGREHALAAAESLATRGERWIWILEDARDAFNQVPHGRLLDVVRGRIKNAELVDLIKVVIQNDEGRGLRQGGSLSPLLMNLYLDHFLDRPWAREVAGTPLIRYADDLCVLNSDRNQGEDRYARLKSRLTAAGMPLKGVRETTTFELHAGAPVEWLGYTVRNSLKGLEVLPAEKSWNRLIEELRLAHAKPDSPIRANDCVTGWLGQLGPCLPYLQIGKLYARIVSLAHEQAFDEPPSLDRCLQILDGAYQRWTTIRRTVCSRLSGE